jgi:hypothetical protein
MVDSMRTSKHIRNSVGSTTGSLLRLADLSPGERDINISFLNRV